MANTIAAGESPEGSGDQKKSSMLTRSRYKTIKNHHIIINLPTRFQCEGASCTVLGFLQGFRALGAAEPGRRLFGKSSA
jgi:hypothetical protein